MFTRNSFGVLAIGIAVLTLNLLRSFLFLPPAIIVMDLVLFRLSSVSTTTASKHLQGLPKILPVLNQEKGNAYSILDLTKLFDIVFEVLGCSKLIGLKSAFSCSRQLQRRHINYSGTSRKHRQILWRLI